MGEVYFIIPGDPKGKARPRVTRYGTYTPESTRRYEALVRKCWQDQTGGLSLPPDTPIRCSIHAYFSVPKSLSKKKQQALYNRPHTKKPDCDNIAKAVLDSLNGYAFHDDSAVSELRIEKVYTDGEPFTGVYLSAISFCEE